MVASGNMGLSVCIPVLNRSKTEAGPLLPNCLRSLQKAPLFLEIVIVDFGSTDHHPSEWAETIAPRARIIQLDEPFSRGRGLNVAAEQAHGSELLFLDADMLVPLEVLVYADEVSRAGGAYFPVCWSLGNRAGTYGWWRHKGWGNCAMSRELWKSTGWVEKRRWGGDDNDMRAKLEKLGATILRPRVDGFIHQWHPKRMRHATTRSPAPLPP